MKRIACSLHHRFFQKAFLSTVWQYIFFKIIFGIYTQAYIISHSYTITVWNACILYIVIPLIGGYICCRIINRRNFKFQKGNIRAALPIKRLAVRMLAVTCFVISGYALEKMRAANPELPVDLLVKIGLNNDFIFEFIFRFSPYILTAIFPVSYAVVEWLFKPIVKN